jgi:phospholipid transport system substrate-binding protein
MGRTWLYLPLVFAVATTAIVSTGLAATDPSAETSPSAETPAYMAGLDPKGLGSPEEIVRRRWGAVLRVLQDEEIDQQAKESRIEKIVRPVFDVQAMTRLALGRDNWGKFTAPQREEFSRLFIKRLKELCGRRIADYGGEEVLFKPPLPPKTPKGRKPSTQPATGLQIVHVPIEIISETRRWVVLHKFRKVGTVYRIYDIEIEGVSLLQSYRSQFNDVLRRGTPEDLLARLRKPPPQPSTPPDPEGGAQP